MKLSNQIKQVVRQIANSPLNIHSYGKPGEQVIYIPSHLFGDPFNAHQKPESWNYPNGIQPGFIYKVLSNDAIYAVRYWMWDPAARVFLPELRTISNSEMTQAYNLFYFQMFDTEVVEKAMKQIEANQS